jgi:acyl-CoA thioester hydrolase
MTRDAVSPRSAAPAVHVCELRVIYGDTDQMGFAYYANYLRWFEVGRNEYLRAVGFPYSRLEAEGVILPVVEAGCRYMRTAHYDDLLRLESWIETLGRVKVRFAYRVGRAGEREPLATGFTVHACLDSRHRPTRLPEAMLAALHRFERHGDAKSGREEP